MITYQLETWEQYYSECERLWQEHYASMAADGGRSPMGPDIPFYTFMAARGALQILTARKSGRMIGYCLVFVKRHSHYPLLCGFEDAYYVERQSRGPRVGLRLITETERHARARGVQKMFFYTKVCKEHNQQRLFEHLGYVATDTVMSRWIGD